jgi:hypothetical protein
MCMRTRYGHDKLLVALTREIYIGVAMRELVCRLGIGEVMQHGLLHGELWVRHS